MASTAGGETEDTLARGRPRTLPSRPAKRRFCYRCLAVILVIIAGFAVGRRGARAPVTPDTAAATPFRQAAEAANIVLIVIDGARADHLGCYGYPRPTTPTVDRLAAEAITFTNHYCQIPMTAASTVSLFTSQFPDTHGIFYQAPPDWRPPFTLAGALSRAGFRTALFSSNPSASPAVGIGREFAEAYHRTKPVDEGGSFSPKSLLVQFDTWLEANRDSRLFAYIHFLPPHTPYDQPDDFTRIFADTPPGYAAS
ncbi:MAG: sulfatase-like hydrolase/transferase, partial [Armatimonadota bacterium]|nr:sulfatase-like hydrolase/transferase [Armatimonadota bacterium]